MENIKKYAMVTVAVVTVVALTVMVLVIPTSVTAVKGQIGASEQTPAYIVKDGGSGSVADNTPGHTAQRSGEGANSYAPGQQQ